MSRVNVNALKEIKDLKDATGAPAQLQNQNVIPPFIRRPETTETTPRLININPLIIVFDGPPGAQCQKAIHLTNPSQIQVILLNASKYHRRHAFVVQVKSAKMEENNRKDSCRKSIFFLQWNNSDRNDRYRSLVALDFAAEYERPFSYYRNVCRQVNPFAITAIIPISTVAIMVDTFVSGVRPVAVDEMGGHLARMIATTPSCSGGIGIEDIRDEVAIIRRNGVTKIVDGAAYRHGLAPSSSSGNSTSASAPAPQIDHEEYTPEVKKLTEEVKKAAERKQASTQKMVAAVNDVKKLEVELDRAAQNLNQVQQKYNEQEDNVAILRMRLKKVREQLAIAREADRRRNNS
ncbi:unnamed protein product [Nippostrongylus brasiliensis]|uniref:Major sperm protein n=1 Tax=Nippostrongylus brasiliensis TaxID=27835 RepID=A0A0N4XXD1_NIPBR|nr:unnamed protein product [Nippostrongylus brasiliensis]